MTTIRAFVTRHPVAAYFALTFAISCLLILNPLAISGASLLTYSLALAGAVWVVVAGVSLVNGKPLWSHPPRRQMA